MGRKFYSNAIEKAKVHTTSWSFKGGPESDLHWGKNSSADTGIGWRNLLNTAGRRSLQLTYDRDK